MEFPEKTGENWIFPKREEKPDFLVNSGENRWETRTGTRGIIFPNKSQCFFRDNFPGNPEILGN
jgi:hypothetical protein